MKSKEWVCIFLFLSQLVGCSRTTAEGQTVARYIQAIQRHDFRTVVDLTEGHQQAIKRIKSENPQFLWPKLVSQYYESATSEEASRGWLSMFPSGCKWEITETRRGVPKTVVYVIVSYSSPANSPIDAARRMKQAVLSFEVATASGLVSSIGRTRTGDVYWPIPPLTNEMATDLAPNFHQATVELPRGVGLTDELVPTVSGIGRNSTGESFCCLLETGDISGDFREKWLSRLADLFRQNGFNVEDYPRGMFNLRGLKVELPETWNRYRIGIGTFRLNESTSFRVVSLEQQSDLSAVAKLHLSFSGCSPACRMLKEFYAHKLHLESDGYVSTPGAFFTPDFPEATSAEGSDERGWPMEADGVAHYSWDARSLMWRGDNFKLTGVGPFVPVSQH